MGQRQLDSSEYERLTELIRSILLESVGTYLLLTLAIAFVIGASTVNLANGWFGLVVFSVASVLLRYVPQRRFFDPRVVLRLRKDLADRRVDVCRSEEMTLEVLAASHIIWSRNGVAVEAIIVAHRTLTAMVPPHAARAAQFVRPSDDAAPFYIHQRALSSDEMAELDSYVPRPLFVVWMLAVVGTVGCLSSFALALSGRLNNLFPPFLFVVVAAWAGISVFRAWRARRIIARDLEAGFVVIVRAEDGGSLGPPEEFLPFSHLIWTRSGETAEWRKRLRRK